MKKRRWEERDGYDYFWIIAWHRNVWYLIGIRLYRFARAGPAVYTLDFSVTNIWVFHLSKVPWTAMLMECY